MKTKKWLYYTLMLLPLAATLIALPLLPDQIPAHYGADNQVENLSELPVNITNLVFACLGLLLIVCGNIMPKLKNNSVIGLRTTWSRKNEITWKKSQKFGGITFIISGILITAVSLMTRAGACLLWSMLILIADAAVSIWYSWRMAKKYG